MCSFTSDIFLLHYLLSEKVTVNRPRQLELVNKCSPASSTKLTSNESQPKILADLSQIAQVGMWMSANDSQRLNESAILCLKKGGPIVSTELVITSIFTCQ